VEGFGEVPGAFRVLWAARVMGVTGAFCETRQGFVGRDRFVVPFLAGVTAGACVPVCVLACVRLSTRAPAAADTFDMLIDRLAIRTP
jgi:hypothetical protein